MYGPPPECDNGRAGLCSFNVEGLEGVDLAVLMNDSGVAMR